MFKLNLKIAWRNLWKNKVYTAINVIGLSLGLAGFIFTLVYINYQKSYDCWDVQLKNVYQIQELDYFEIKEGNKEWMDVADQRFAELLPTAMPQIEATTQFSTDVNTQSIIIEKKDPFLQKNILSANKSFFQVFPFHFVYGNSNSAFSNPNSVVVKKSFAKKHYGNINPLGKVIKIAQQNWTKPQDYVITGVVSDPTTPSTVDFEIVQYWAQHRTNDQFNTFGITYAKIKPGLTAKSLNEIIQSIYLPQKLALLRRQKLPISDFLNKDIKPSVRLQSLQEIHQQPLGGENWLTLIKPVILLSTLLLLISIVNFINMFTAQAVSRAKEVGVKKVIGASRRSLIFQFLIETTFQCIIALLSSVIILEGFLPYLNQLFVLNLSISNGYASLNIFFQMFLLLVVIILLAGLYPSFFLSSYQPQNVLKGSFGHSKNGKNIRSLLVGLQFVIAVGFFIGIMVISKQINFMENRDPGITTKAVIHIKAIFDKRIAEQIKNVDGVQNVGSNNGVIGKNQQMTGVYKYENESKELNTVLVNFEGLQALNVRLVKGRLFDSSNAQDSLGTAIINESLENAYGGNMLGKYIFVADTIPTQVIGVIKDIQVKGFENLIEPTVYTATSNNATGYPNRGVNYLIKYDIKKQKTVLNAINEIWKKQYPTFPLTYTFIQNDLEEILVNHKRFKKMVELFSGLSISLSLIGLFSLAAFLTKQRTKEIAIRKILGANHKEIFILLNKSYIWLMLLANIASWPLIYIAINYWLNGFAYRIDMSYLPYIIAFVVSILTTTLTVSIQVNNAVKENPVKALKYE